MIRELFLRRDAGFKCRGMLDNEKKGLEKQGLTQESGLIQGARKGT